HDMGNIHHCSPLFSIEPGVIMRKHKSQFVPFVFFKAVIQQINPRCDSVFRPFSDEPFPPFLFAGFMVY
ncbi:hypothetical protein ACFYV4_17020, partial [Bacillus velezensis]